MNFYVFLLCLLFYPAYAADKTSEFTIANIPAWVELAKNEDVSSISDQESTSGVHYQIWDSQIKKNMDSVDYFMHISKKIVNQNGVENEAFIEIEFNPLCESLVLHHVNVRREEKDINHLKIEKIKVLQREKSLKMKHYTGIKSIHLILEDIRIGDTIEYSYTIKSKETNDNNNFYTKIYLSNTFPVHFFE
jgi:hypothetical protein